MTGRLTTAGAPADTAAADIVLSKNTFTISAAGSVIGTFALKQVNQHDGEQFNYSLIEGEGSTDNKLFSISGNSLLANRRLAPGTYSIWVEAANDSNSYSKKFTLIACLPLPPVVATDSASRITTTGALLFGSANGNHSNIKIVFEYGPTTDYGSSITGGQTQSDGIALVPASREITGLLPNTLYHFRAVGVNAGGTTNGPDRTFTTAAAPPVAVTGETEKITTTGALLNGTVNANNLSSKVSFEYGLTPAYGSSAAAGQSPASGSSPLAVSAAVTGLTPNTFYHYRLTGQNAAGRAQGSDRTFITLPAPPAAVTIAVAGLSTTRATLQGSVNANNQSSAITFEYGTTVKYGTTVPADESPVAGTSTKIASKVISGLIPNTVYHYRVAGVNETGTTLGADQTFTTAPAPPAAITANAGSLTTTEAVLNSTINAYNQKTTVTFEYGLTVAYGSTAAVDQVVAGSANTVISKKITGLTPNTVYHYRVTGVNATGTSTGQNKTFTTLPAPPSVTTNAAGNITTIGAILNAAVNANSQSTTVNFEYGSTVAYGTTITAEPTPISGPKQIAVSRLITGLTPNTLYHYRAVGVNATGTTNGLDLTFTTAAATPVTVTSAPENITAVGALLKGAVNANNQSTTVTFEYGPALSYGSTVKADQNPLEGFGNKTASKPVTGLTPNTVYHYRAIGTNATGTTFGADQTFTTGKIPALSSIEPYAICYSYTGSAPAVSSTIAASSGAGTLANAVLWIGEHYDDDEDLLAFAPANGITGLWDPDEGTLTLSGVAPVANYSAALRSVKYICRAPGGPDEPFKTINITVNDGVINSNPVRRNINAGQQPSNLRFSNISGSSFSVIFDPSETGGSYLVVRHTGSAPAFVPKEGVRYPVGAQGPDYIAYSGTGTSFTETDMEANIDYYYTIYNWRGSGASSSYVTAAPLTGINKILMGNSPGETIPATNSVVSRHFPYAGVSVTFPNGSTGTTLSVSKIPAAPAHSYNFSDLGSLYFAVHSTNASPGRYDIVLDFSSLGYADWNSCLVLKRNDSGSPWQDVTQAPLNAIITNRATDGTPGKFTISGLNSFSEFALGRQAASEDFVLNQNYPNPFNPSTKIKFQLPKSCYVNLSVYTVIGQLIETLVDGERDAGSYEVNFSNRDLPSGIYFYKLRAGSYSQSKKMLLVR